MSVYKLCALTGEMVGHASELAEQVVSLRPVSLHVLYLHTPPAGLYTEYEFPVQFNGFESELPFEERLRELPRLFAAMNAALARVHSDLLRAPMLAAYEDWMRERFGVIADDPEWSTGDLHCAIYTIDGANVECRRAAHRILGSAYVVQHPQTREECLIWFAPPGAHQALDLRAWCTYLMGRELRVDRDPARFLAYISR